MQPTLSIHITDLCNSRCTFCVVGSPLYTKNTVQFGQVLDFLKSNANQGFWAVNLHGGEPTIDPHFLDILANIRELGYKEVHLQTNGIKLADSSYAKKLVDLGVTLFIVSLHGDSPAMQDELTHTPLGLERTLEGIRQVKALGASVRTNTVITKRNVEHVLGIARLACELSVDHVNFSNLHPVGSAFFSFQKLVPPFAVIRTHLLPAVEHLLIASRKVTLEGFPYCTMPNMESLHLNEQGRRIRMLMRGQVIENYDEFMSTSCRQFGAPCQTCEIREPCGGVYNEYIQYRGWAEFAPLQRVRLTSHRGT